MHSVLSIWRDQQLFHNIGLDLGQFELGDKKVHRK